MRYIFTTYVNTVIGMGFLVQRSFLSLSIKQISIKLGHEFDFLVFFSLDWPLVFVSGQLFSPRFGVENRSRMESIKLKSKMSKQQTQTEIKKR